MKAGIRYHLLLAALGGASLILSAAPAAALTPAQKCTAAKLKATAKKADTRARCYEKAKLAAPPDLTCLFNAEKTFEKAFTKAEAPGACTRTGDAASTERTVDAFVIALVQALQLPAGAGTPVQRCAIAKLKAASKMAVAKTQCQIKNLSLPGASLLALCYGAAEDKFHTAIAKAEKPGKCATGGEAAAIEATVEAFVGAIVMSPQPATPPPSNTPAPGLCGNGVVDQGEQCDGQQFCGSDCRLAGIAYSACCQFDSGLGPSFPYCINAPFTDSGVYGTCGADPQVWRGRLCTPCTGSCPPVTPPSDGLTLGICQGSTFAPVSICCHNLSACRAQVVASTEDLAAFVRGCVYVVSTFDWQVGICDAQNSCRAP